MHRMYSAFFWAKRAINGSEKEKEGSKLEQDFFRVLHATRSISETFSGLKEAQ